jgi:hypothetical protein
MNRRKTLPLPTGFEELGDTALAAMDARPAAPRICIERAKDGRWNFANPYSEEHGERWLAMLAGAFGTRSGGAINHFLDTLTKLVAPGSWDEKRQVWFPCEDDFQAALNIISSLRPENEAQAAYAAQLVALHMSAVKLGAQMSKSWADPRTAAILSKTSRAYGEGMERLARLQGKVQPKQVNQTIQVVYVDKRSVHIDGGVGPNGEQPHASDLSQEYCNAASTVSELSALPSPCPDNRQAMPIARSSGEEKVPNAWWGPRIWSALRRAQWKLQAWSVDK